MLSYLLFELLQDDIARTSAYNGSAQPYHEATPIYNGSNVDIGIHYTFYGNPGLERVKEVMEDELGVEVLDITKGYIHTIDVDYLIKWDIEYPGNLWRMYSTDALDFER